MKSFNGKTPRIAESAFVSEAAYVVGNVEIGENSSVWPGAVIRGDFGSIKIGNNTTVEDGCVIHAGSPETIMKNLTIGDNVHIGHGAVINCQRIGNKVLIGMNATLLHDAEIGSQCIIGAGGGTDVAQAVAHRAKKITALEMNQQIIRLMLGPLREFSSGLYNRQDVEIISAEGRSFLQTTRQKYDIINI